MTKLEIREKIEKLEKAINSSAMQEQFKPELRKKKSEFEKALQDLEKAEVEVKKATVEHKKAVTLAKKKPKEKVAKSVIIKKAKAEKAHKSASTRLSKLIKSFNEGRSKSSIEIDGKRKALPTGKRISKDGNVYSENRPDHADISRRKKPYLADGGMMAKGGKLSNRGAYLNDPENYNYHEDIDAQKSHRAKPAGWRYTNAGAKRLGVNPKEYVSKAHLDKYNGKYFTDRYGEEHRYIYQERRADKADIKRTTPYLEKGGEIKKKIDSHNTLKQGTLVETMTVFNGKKHIHQGTIVKKFDNENYIVDFNGYESKVPNNALKSISNNKLEYGSEIEHIYKIGDFVKLKTDGSKGKIIDIGEETGMEDGIAVQFENDVVSVVESSEITPCYECGGYMEDGGSIASQNKQMVAVKAKEIQHHAKELLEAIKGNEEVPAWVVAKIERSATDISDSAHYLEGMEGESFGKGGAFGGKIERKLTIEDAIWFLENLDFDKSNNNLRHNGITLIRKKRKGFYPEYIINGVEVNYLYDELKDTYGKEEQSEVLYNAINDVLESERYKKEQISLGKKTYNFIELKKVLEQLLKEKGINYSYQESLSHNSGYFKTDYGTIRISDHTGAYRDYSHVKDFIFTGNWYSIEDLENIINNYSDKKMAFGGSVDCGCEHSMDGFKRGGVITFSKYTDVNKPMIGDKYKSGTTNGIVYEVSPNGNEFKLKDEYGNKSNLWHHINSTGKAKISRSKEAFAKGGEIGKTQSNKPIYDYFEHPEHRGFTSQDHTDARYIYAAKMSNLSRKGNKKLNELEKEKYDNYMKNFNKHRYQEDDFKSKGGKVESDAKTYNYIGREVEIRYPATSHSKKYGIFDLKYSELWKEKFNTLEEAKQFISDNKMNLVKEVINGKEMKWGGRTTFKEKVNAIAESLKNRVVKPKYRKKYGITYDAKEAKEAATKIVGKMVAKEKMSK